MGTSLLFVVRIELHTLAVEKFCCRRFAPNSLQWACIIPCLVKAHRGSLNRISSVVFPLAHKSAQKRDTGYCCVISKRLKLSVRFMAGVVRPFVCLVRSFHARATEFIAWDSHKLAMTAPRLSTRPTRSGAVVTPFW